MKVVAPQDVKGKKILLRMDLDVPLKKSGEKVEVAEDFRLKAALPTLNLCLEHGEKVIIMGHLGRPEGKKVPELSVAPIYDWLEENVDHQYLDEEKLFILENLRFEEGEEKEDLEFAKKLAEYGDIYVNEAFAAHHMAASTTVLPTLLPHFAGLRFAQEVETLTKVRENPKHPLVSIVGGVKVEDKYPAIVALSKISDAVLVGGLLPQQIKEQNLEIARNIMLGKLNEQGTDLAPETIDAYLGLLKNAQQIIWAGPVGNISNIKDQIPKTGTYQIAQTIINSQAESIVGGGDTVGFLGQNNLLDQFLNSPAIFISTGGGAMLKLLAEGTLSAIEALK